MPLIMSKLNNQGRRDILIILGPDSIERIQRKDPFEVNCWQMPFQERVGVLSITYGTKEECAKMEALVREGKVDEAIKLALSGWEYRPDLGDHDRGPEPLT
jgi:hypothetical protein